MCIRIYDYFFVSHIHVHILILLNAVNESFQLGSGAKPYLERIEGVRRFKNVSYYSVLVYHLSLLLYIDTVRGRTIDLQNEEHPEKAYVLAWDSKR